MTLARRRLRVPLLLAACLAIPTVGAAQSGESAPAPTRTPVVRSPGNAVWEPSIARARARAEKEKKLVFVEIDEPGCGNCDRMDALLYTAFDFEALLIDMVPVKTSRSSPEGMATAARYGIGELPAILIVTPEGRLAFLMQGFMNAPDFYSHVKHDLQAYRVFARRVDAQDVAALPAGEALDTGRELAQRRDPAAALARFQRVSQAPDATAEMRESALQLAAEAELDLGRPLAARASIQKLLATSKDPARRERAELFRAQIPLAEKKPSEALTLLREFRKSHPDSRYAAEVDQVIRKLESQAPR